VGAMNRLAAVTGTAALAIGAVLAAGPAMASSTQAGVFAVAQPAHAPAPAHVLSPPGASGRSGPLVALVDTRTGQPPLLFRGGAIARTTRTYSIFWNPGHLQSGAATRYAAGYKTLVNRYFRDVGGSGLYNVLTQYFGVSGSKLTQHILNKSTFGATFTDTTPFPKTDCTTADTGVNCVSQATLAAEVAKVAKAHAIAAGMTTIFFIYTPLGEGSCFTGGVCGTGNDSYRAYCAYHSFGTATFGPSPTLLWANIPYPQLAGNPNVCASPGTGQTFPNGNPAADAAINVTSHEHLEATSDPLLNAWFDSAGYEVSDECAWQFGPAATGGGDVVWHGHPYDVQMAGSNASAACVISGP
jgi:hypothetical protein